MHHTSNSVSESESFITAARSQSAWHLADATTSVRSCVLLLLLPSHKLPGLAHGEDVPMILEHRPESTWHLQKFLLPGKCVIKATSAHNYHIPGNMCGRALRFDTQRNHSGQRRGVEGAPFHASRGLARAPQEVRLRTTFNGKHVDRYSYATKQEQINATCGNDLIAGVNNLRTAAGSER